MFSSLVTEISCILTLPFAMKDSPTQILGRHDFCLSLNLVYDRGIEMNVILSALRDKCIIIFLKHQTEAHIYNFLFIRAQE